MDEFSRHTLRLSSSASVFSWSKVREAEFLTQKINSRMVELEKDGTNVKNNLGKLSSWVQEMMDDARINVEILKTKDDLKDSYQEVSRVLVEVEDNIAMLAASIARWQISEVHCGENDVTNNIDESDKYRVTEPVHSHQVAEEVLKESIRDKKKSEGLTKNTGQCNINNETATEKIMKNQLNHCECVTPMTGDPNNFPYKETPSSSVMFVSNLDPEFMDCDRLFNLISQYATVKRIQFLKPSRDEMDFRSALVELSNKEGANRLINFLKDEKCFNRMIHIEPSSKMSVIISKFNTILPNGTKAFKEFSEDERTQYPRHRSGFLYPPSRTLYFYRTPKITDEEFYEIFEKLKAPLPYKVMWFPDNIPMDCLQFNMNFGGGCLQFKSKEEALEAICIVNHAIIKPLNMKIHLAFTDERGDCQFYCHGKIDKYNNNVRDDDTGTDNTTVQAGNNGMDSTTVQAGKSSDNTTVQDGNNGMDNTTVQAGKSSDNTTVQDGNNGMDNTTVQDGKNSDNTTVQAGKNSDNTTTVQDGNNSDNTTVQAGNNGMYNSTVQAGKNSQINGTRALKLILHIAKQFLEEELNNELVPTANVSVACPKLIYQNHELMELAKSSFSKLLPPDLEKIVNEIPSIVKNKCDS